jgi:hypothetical protein
MSQNATTALTDPSLQALEYLHFAPADMVPAEALSRFAYGAKATGLNVYSSQFSTTISGHRSGRRLLGSIKLVGLNSLPVIQAAPAPGQPGDALTAIRAVSNTNAKLDAIMLVTTQIVIPEGVKGDELVTAICGHWVQAAAAQLGQPPAFKRFQPVAGLVANGTNRHVAQIRTVAAGPPLMLMATAPLTPGGKATIIARRFCDSDEAFFQIADEESTER